MVQWLGLWASTAGGLGSIPGRGAKILQAAQCSQKKNFLNKAGLLKRVVHTPSSLSSPPTHSATHCSVVSPSATPRRLLLPRSLVAVISKPKRLLTGLDSIHLWAGQTERATPLPGHELPAGVHPLCLQTLAVDPSVPGYILNSPGCGHCNLHLQPRPLPLALDPHTQPTAFWTSAQFSLRHRKLGLSEMDLRLLTTRWLCLPTSSHQSPTKYRNLGNALDSSFCFTSESNSLQFASASSPMATSSHPMNETASQQASLPPLLVPSNLFFIQQPGQSFSHPI